jgi:hypothetical protein
VGARETREVAVASANHSYPAVCGCQIKCLSRICNRIVTLGVRESNAPPTTEMPPAGFGLVSQPASTDQHQRKTAIPPIQERPAAAVLASGRSPFNERLKLPCNIRRTRCESIPLLGPESHRGLLVERRAPILRVGSPSRWIADLERKSNPPHTPSSQEPMRSLQARAWVGPVNLKSQERNNQNGSAH